MVCFNDSNTLVLGGYKFSKLNRKKGILVTSVDPDDTSQSVVVSSNEGSIMNGINHGNEDGRGRMPRRSSQKHKGTELEKKALVFCKLVNKILRNQNSSCFVGYEVIYKMVTSGLAENRAEALALGKELSKKLRLLYRVEFKRNTFSDDGKLYKFRPEVLLSVIMKSPMTIQKLTPSDHDRKNERLESKPTSASDLSYSPMKFKKFAPKNIYLEEKKEEEITVERNRYGKPMKKGRRPSVKRGMDQMHMIPKDQPISSEEEWGKPMGNHRAMMDSIRESGDDDHSVYTEVTVSEHNNANTFPPVPTLPLHEDDEDSYMELTVSTGGGEDSKRGSTHSYFDEYTLEDEDEFDIMSVPTTPVVKEKIKVRGKPNVIPVNDFISPNDVTQFDHYNVLGSRRSVKANQDSSLSSRMRRGELDIEVPYLDEADEDEFLEDE